MKTIYYYDPETKLFTTEGFAQESPLEPGVWLIPPNCTEIAPPTLSNKELAIFNGENWDLIPDKRGIYYNITTFDKIENEDPFNEPENSTSIAPPEPQEGKFIIWENGWTFIDEKYAFKPSYITNEEWNKTEYQRLRAPEYPSLKELADALYWNSKGDASHLEQYYEKCEEVKNKYPKN